MFEKYKNLLLETYASLSKRRFVQPIMAFLGLMVVSFFLFKPAFFTIFFLLIGAISLLYKKFISLGVGIELTSFSAIISGILFGWLSGFVVGAGSIVLGGLVMGKFETDAPKYAFHAFLTGLAGVAATLIPVTNLLFWSMVLIVAYDVIYTVWVINYYQIAFFKLMVWLCTHFAFTYYMFSHHAGKMIAWVSGLL